MKTYHLTIKEPEDNYQIIAIYTDEPDYRLAFLLNKHLNLQLVKSTSIIDKTQKTDFTVYEYEDINLFQNWLLLNNHCYVESEIEMTSSFNLFNESSTIFKKRKYYFKKYKKAKFLLKIIADTEKSYIQNLIKILHQIPQVYTAELLLLNKIKNKKLLTF